MRLRHDAHLEVYARCGEGLHESLVSESGEGLECGQRGMAGSAVYDTSERALDHIHKPSGAERREQQQCERDGTHLRGCGACRTRLRSSRD